LLCFRDYVFKRICLEVLLCLVGVEEALMLPFVPPPSKPEVTIGLLPLLLQQHALKSCQKSLNISSDIVCNMTMLHAAGPHIFNTHVGGRRWQAHAPLSAVVLSLCDLCVAQAVQIAAASLQLVAFSHRVILMICYTRAAHSNGLCLRLIPRRIVAYLMLLLQTSKCLGMRALSLATKRRCRPSLVRWRRTAWWPRLRMAVSGTVMRC
jgi:hypothetical protein